MDFRGWVESSVWERKGWPGRLVFAAFLPLSAAFAAGVRLRASAYRLGILRAERGAVPVVSVGNLTVGGTGKTPFALWLSCRLVQRGRRPALVLRGYRGSASGVVVVSRGAGPELPAAQAGDEAVLLARRFPGPVIAAARRSRGVAMACELGCDLAVLDDGFQHRSLARDMDLVLIDGRSGPLLPAGPLREGPTALRRADAVILVRRDGCTSPQGPPAAALGKPCYTMSIVPAVLVESVAGKWRERPLRDLANRRVVAVCGIARPGGFHASLDEWGAKVVDSFVFPDHHAYTQADWQAVSRAGMAADFVVTTEKDLVKLEDFPFATGKLVALRIEARVERGEELVDRVLEAVRSEDAAACVVPASSVEDEGRAAGG